MSETGEGNGDITIVAPPDDDDGNIWEEKLDDDDYMDWINYIDSRSEPIRYEIDNIQKEEQKSEEHEIVKSFFVKLSDYL